MTDDLTARYSAVELVRLGVEALGGKGGGGRPDMAQGGGPDASKAADAIAAVRHALESSLQLSEAVLVDLGVAMGPVIASIHEKRDSFRERIREEADLHYKPKLRTSIADPG